MATTRSPARRSRPRSSSLRGDAILRRNAAQSIAAGYSREEACAILERVLDRESDPNFARFLDDVIQQNCR